MSEILFQYHRISPTTWVYVSSLLTIGLYFKFGRVWSVRNLDLVLLILLAPGLLMVIQGKAMQRHWPAVTTESQDSSEAIAPVDGTPPLPLGKLPPQVPLLMAPPHDSYLAVATTGLEVETADGQTFPLDGEDEPPTSPTLDENSPLPLPEPPDDIVVSPPLDPNSPLAEENLDDDPTLAHLNPGGEEARRAAEATVSPQVAKGRQWEIGGYIWLFAVGLILLVRLLVDPTMVRRPLLEPNLTTGGLTFLGCSLFVFLMANVITGTPTDDDLRGPQAAADLIARRDTTANENTLSRYGPGLGVLYTLPTISTTVLVDVPHDVPVVEKERQISMLTAKTMAIVSHLAIVIGMVLIGYWHFDNIKMGIGAAALYLLLPYTAEMTGRVHHALPAALLVWAIALYRRPFAAGAFLMAAGVIYYPLFLLPLWIAFYWQRGLLRFLGGFGAMLALVALSLVFTSSSLASFWMQLQAIFGISHPAMDNLEGIWGLAWDSAYRIPMLAAFIAMSCSFALWPVQKNLGTLLSCTGAVMLAAQFWHGFGGGTIMAWYLPLVLLTVFRPNLEDRVAISVLDKGRWPRVAPVSRAA